MIEAIHILLVACDIKCHRHCAVRAKPCTVVVDTSMVVNRNEKVVTSIEDVDNLGRFLLEKVIIIVFRILWANVSNACGNLQPGLVHYTLGGQ